ncbi:MAG: polysaccharide deacetylase family protein [Saprospiraceae bacterium]|nr:polysaccharide deacetylase family protein [Saprospiraceae bacterium]
MSNALHIMRLIVYTPTVTARVQYAWEVLLRYVLKIDYELVSNLDFYQSADAYKINYSTQRQNNQEVFIPAGNLLFESGIRQQIIEILSTENLPVFFQQTASNADLPFDLPALVFYLTTRYEEYLPYRQDAHRRFPAWESLAYREGFLQQPVVNQWACRLRTIMELRYPRIQMPRLIYRFQPTYDVDMAWAYRYKGWKRNVLAGLKELLQGKFVDLEQRMQVLSGKAEDPFFTFAYLDELHQQYQLQPIYFFLLGDYSAFDKNIPPQRPALQELIQTLHRQYPIGIHPSYRSDGQPQQIRREVQRLKDATDDPVVRSRQHFLLLRFPQTYRNLLAAGITSDYTMGFAVETGFRASIATAYPWYDLENEMITPLMIHPFQAMDVTLKNYLQLSPQAAFEKVQGLIEAIKSVGGTFSTIWHNSSLSTVDGWQDWKEMYEKMVKMALSNQD